MPGSPDPPGAAVALQIKAKGIRDPRTLKAVARFDRRRFLPPDERHRAHADEAVPIGLGQTISQPYMVGLMTVALELTGAETVLEVGTGSGYQSAVLSPAWPSEVYTIERLPTLSLQGARHPRRPRPRRTSATTIGDGSLGWPEEAPFDRILVTAAVAVRLPRVAVRATRRRGPAGPAPIGDESRCSSSPSSARSRGRPPDRAELIVLPVRQADRRGRLGRRRRLGHLSADRACLTPPGHAARMTASPPGWIGGGADGSRMLRPAKGGRWVRSTSLPTTSRPTPRWPP